MTLGLMPIPRPHLLLLQNLKTQQEWDDYGFTLWADAVPAEVTAAFKANRLSIELLFVPLLERGLIKSGAKDEPERDGADKYVCITPAGVTCLQYGYMPMAQAEPTVAQLIDMISLPPSPTRYLEGEVVNIEALARELVAGKDKP